MPMRCPRNRANASSFSCAELDAVDLDLAFVRPLEAGHDHEQRRFARAGRADYADRLAFADCQRDVAQDMHASRAAAETEIDAAHRDRRKDHCLSTFKPCRPHMGICAILVQALAFAAVLAIGLARRRGADASPRGFRRQPDRRIWLSPRQGFSRSPRGGASRQRFGCQGHQRRRFRRYGCRRPRPLRLGGSA